MWSFYLLLIFTLALILWTVGFIVFVITKFKKPHLFTMWQFYGSYFKIYFMCDLLLLPYLPCGVGSTDVNICCKWRNRSKCGNIACSGCHTEPKPKPRQPASGVYISKHMTSFLVSVRATNRERFPCVPPPPKKCLQGRIMQLKNKSNLMLKKPYVLYKVKSCKLCLPGI